MNMVRHDTVGVDNELFFLLTETNAIQKKITVAFTSENVNPINDGKGNKVGSVRIMNFILAAQGYRYSAIA